MLAEQHLDIRFIIDHEDKKVHRSTPGAGVTASWSHSVSHPDRLSLRQQLSRKTLHAVGHRYVDADGRRVIKMVSGCDCLDPGRNDIDDGGGEQDGDDNYRQCSAHWGPFP